MRPSSMKIAAKFAVLAVLVVKATPVSAHECTCRHKANDIPEGQVVCISTPKGSQMAQCVKVLNNTSWKFLGTPCPSAGKPKSVSNNQG